jgi:hypothetical protein
VGQLSLDWDLGAEREHAYRASRLNAQRLHGWLTDPGQVSDRELQSLGLSRTEGPLTIGQVSGQLGRIEVHSVRPARRVGPDGQLLSDFIVEITQRFQPDVPGLEVFRGGCTLIIDRRLKEVRYLVRKRVDHAERFAAQQDFHLRSADELRANYSMETDRLEPFAFLHHGSRTP